MVTLVRLRLTKRADEVTRGIVAMFDLTLNHHAPAAVR